MAWDLTHIRYLETIATKTEIGSFFIPFFVTFDKKFRFLLSHNPINFIIIDDSAKSVQSAKVHELETQKCINEHLSEKAKLALTPEGIKSRKNILISNSAIEQLVIESNQIIQKQLNEIT